MSEMIVLDAQIKQEVTDFSSQVKALAVTNPEQAQIASSLRALAKAGEKKVKEFFAPLKKKADEAHAALCASEKKELAPFAEGVLVIDGLLSKYKDEQDRKAREDRAKKEAEARKQAEDEALARAAAMESAGQAEEAQAIVSEPVNVVVAPVQTVKVAGVSFREVWNGRVTDLQTLVKAVAEGRAPITLLEANLTAIRQYATATKGALTVPGVEFYSQKQVAGKAA